MRKHGFSAILFLALIILSIFSWLQFAGRRVNMPAQTGPEFALNNKDHLNVNIAVPLPDLLNDDKIPLDVNPTEALDLLGAPDRQNGSTQSGPRPPGTRVQNRQDGSKIILIDGTPIDKLASLGSLSSPLTKAPIQGFTRMSPFGLVPRVATDGRTALNSYAKPFTPVSGQKYIALIIGGLGLDPQITQRAINELPAEISLSFAAQTTNLQSWINRARAKGHEVLIELPMENENFDKGAGEVTYTLNQQSPHSANIRSLDYLLSRAEGYFAVTNYGGEVLLNNGETLTPILTHLKNAGLGFIYDGSIQNSKVSNIANTTKLPFVSAHTMLDNGSHGKKDVSALISSLPAQEGSIKIGMGFSYTGTIEGVLDWLQDPKDVKIAPASYAFSGK